MFAIERSGDGAQRVAARLVRGLVHVDESVTAAENDGARAFTLAFPDGRRAGVAVGRALVDAVEVVHGTVTAGEGRLALAPESPAWTTSRVVHVTLERAGAAVVLRQSVALPGVAD